MGSGLEISFFEGAGFLLLTPLVIEASIIYWILRSSRRMTKNIPLFAVDINDSVPFKPDILSKFQVR